MARSSSKKIEPVAKRRLIVVPVTDWMNSEFEAELERSFDRESARMAKEAAARSQGMEAMELAGQDDIRRILEELVDISEVKTAAEPDYVAAVSGILSRKLKFPLDLIYQGSCEDGPVASISADAATKLHASSQSEGHRRLRRELDLDADDELFEKSVADWSDEELSALLGAFISKNRIQLSIIDHLASSTDALCCDRLLNREECDKRVTTLHRALQVNGYRPRSGLMIRASASDPASCSTRSTISRTTVSTTTRIGSGPGERPVPPNFSSKAQPGRWPATRSSG